MTRQIWHTSHFSSCYFRIKMTRKLSELKVSCCLADYKVKEAAAWLLPLRIPRPSLKSHQGYQVLNLPLIPLPFCKNSSTFLLPDKRKSSVDLSSRWIPPSSIYHPACEVQNSSHCVRVFVCISKWELLCCANACLTLQGGHTDMLYIQQICNKHNLALSTHLQILWFFLTGKEKWNKV